MRITNQNITEAHIGVDLWAMKFYIDNDHNISNTPPVKVILSIKGCHFFIMPYGKRGELLKTPLSKSYYRHYSVKDLGIGNCISLTHIIYDDEIECRQAYVELCKQKLSMEEERFNRLSTDVKAIIEQYAI